MKPHYFPLPAETNTLAGGFLTLPSHKETGTSFFLERRETG